MSLTQKAMLVTLNISMIGRTGVDRRATKDANTFLGTTQEAGKYNKCKIHDDDIRGVLQKAEQARKHHKNITRPWDERKIRILPATLIMEYTDTMRNDRQEFEDEVTAIQTDWLNIVLKQRQRLKSGLFNIDDYPGVILDINGGCVIDSSLDLTKFFTFGHDMYPMPDKNHLVLDIEKETLEEIKTEMQRNTDRKLKSSRTELLKRLYEPVANMADILSNDKRIYQTLIPSIETQIKILPELNIEGDQDLNRMIQEVKDRLTGYTVGQLKEDEQLKEQMALRAESLKNKIDTYMTVNT